MQLVDNLQYRIQRLASFRAAADDVALPVHTARRFDNRPQTINSPAQDQTHINVDSVRFDFEGQVMRHREEPGNDAALQSMTEIEESLVDIDEW
ncbi:hypothetical protein FQN50_001831 [Emmonsiellopsis sp. PD_5]|nr:hypothetical protein FQN50_001831 [Emmonsiellopsis sp. PD_5]